MMRERGGGDDYDSSDSVSSHSSRRIVSSHYRTRPIQARLSKMINLRKASKTIKKRKRKRRKRNPHLDQQNVHPDHHRAVHHSDKPLLLVVAIVERDPTTPSMGNRVPPLQALELLSSPTERLVPGVLRPKLDLGVIHHITELLRLNHGMGGVCRLLQEIKVRSGNFRLGGRIVLARHLRRNINIIDHPAD